MPNCNPNTLVIKKTVNNGPCGPNCGVNGGICSTPGLGPRRKRDKVFEEIKDTVLLTLGAPVLDIELDDQQLDMIINRMLKVWETYAPREFFNYYTFPTIRGKSVYEMPPEVGYIRNVYYREGSNFAFQASDLGGAIPINYTYPSGMGSVNGGFLDPQYPTFGGLGEWTLYQQYTRLFSSLSSGLGGWEWVGGYRHIKLYPIPFSSNMVIVHYMQKCKDWDEVSEVMIEGALALTKMTLGLIRRKFSNPPGPGGGLSLDGAQLHDEGKQDYEKWKEEIIYRYGELLGPSWG